MTNLIQLKTLLNPEEDQDILLLVEEHRKSGISYSALIKNALRQYMDPKSAIFPRADRLAIDGINGKKDTPAELVRLLGANVITKEELSEYYLGLKAETIKIEKTDMLRYSMNLNNNKGLLRSKREASNDIVLDKATGIIIEGTEQMLSEQAKAKKREEKRREEDKELELWQSEHPGKSPFFRTISESDWHIYEEAYDEIEDDEPAYKIEQVREKDEFLPDESPDGIKAFYAKHPEYLLTKEERERSVEDWARED